MRRLVLKKVLLAPGYTHTNVCAAINVIAASYGSTKFHIGLLTPDACFLLFKIMTLDSPMTFTDRPNGLPHCPRTCNNYLERLGPHY